MLCITGAFLRFKMGAGAYIRRRSYFRNFSLIGGVHDPSGPQQTNHKLPYNLSELLSIYLKGPEVDYTDQWLEIDVNSDRLARVRAQARHASAQAKIACHGKTPLRPLSVSRLVTCLLHVIACSSNL